MFYDHETEEQLSFVLQFIASDTHHSSVTILSLSWGMRPCDRDEIGVFDKPGHGIFFVVGRSEERRVGKECLL